MTVDAVRKPNPMTGKKLDFDAIVIGAGISGLYELHLLRDRYGLNARVFEAGTGVGGTWYWNRYPGCRFDSESWSYGYSFNKEILAEWNWTEHFAPQPETERYLNFVADKLDLRKNIQFSARVKSAHYDDNDESWTVTLENGESYRCRYFVTCVGPLSAPTYPKFDGIESFEGESCHTGLWPKHKVSFEGKRVAVIGTGATGVQTIQEVAKTAKHLTVFQRRPNWCTPCIMGPFLLKRWKKSEGDTLKYSAFAKKPRLVLCTIQIPGKHWKHKRLSAMRFYKTDTKRLASGFGWAILRTCLQIGLRIK